MSSRVYFIKAAVLLTSTLCLVAELSRQAYLSAEELLDLYESMFSSIRNVHFSYTNMLEKNEEGESPKRGRYTRWNTTERIQERQKYYVRRSPAPDGFTHPNSIGESAFDGSVTTGYSPKLRAGSIIPGRTGHGYDLDHMLSYYMLIYKPQPFRNPDMIFLRMYVTPESSVRTQLEQVSGQWCHVVDSRCDNESKPYATVWFATDKGGLPIKFEKYERQGNCVERILVTKVASIDTDTHKIWYPQQATSEKYAKDGYRLYKFNVKSFRANFETSPDTFKVSFPPGTDVIDHVEGIYYTIGASSERTRLGVLQDSEQKPSVAEGPTIPSETDLSQDNNKYLIKILFLVAAIVSVCIIALLIRRKRCASPRG